MQRHEPFLVCTRTIVGIKCSALAPSGPSQPQPRWNRDHCRWGWRTVTCWML